MEIPILKHQAEFIQSEATHTALVAGYGSGKSYAGILKVVKKKLEYPRINVAYYLPTYGLIKDIAYPRFSEMLTQMSIPYELHGTDHEFKTPYGKIILRSLSNPERIVGYEVGYSLIDEADILPQSNMEDCFAKIIARNRSKLPNGEQNKTDVVGTPEGFKWTYNFFIRETKEGRKIIYGKTKDNPFLPEGYIQTLSETYTPQQLDAYLNGQFVNLTSGTVYHHFDRKENHSDREIQPNDVLHIGMDFNITKMNAVVHVSDGKIKTAVGEIVNAYDTFEMCSLIKAKYPNHSVVIYPDASGENRKSSGKSDIAVLRDSGFTIRKASKNPFVKDRVNATNLAFKDIKGDRTYFINTFNCPVYTEATERQTYKNGEPDKSSGFDHITEAAGYFIYLSKKTPMPL